MFNLSKNQASPPVGITPPGDGFVYLGRGARSSLSKYKYVAPSGAPFGVYSRLHASLWQGGDGL
ncbi:hypothetical protein ACSV9I_20185, partial [Rhizobium sp. G187]|uniref:hypothetical protein n=1 Tax=Rhizobium sp. G187 TaxID=3451352 RepID=UPI003EE68E95